MIFHFDKDYARNWTEGQEVLCKILSNGNLLVDGVAEIDPETLYQNGHFIDGYYTPPKKDIEKCNWCKHKYIDHNMMHNNCKAAGYSSFEPIEQLKIEVEPGKAYIEGLEKCVENFRFDVKLPSDLVLLGEFTDIRIGYESTGGVPAIVACGIKPDGNIYVLKNIIPADYGSFSIKELLEKVKETKDHESK